MCISVVFSLASQSVATFCEYFTKGLEDFKKIRLYGSSCKDEDELYIERSPTQAELPQESYISYHKVGHFRHIFLHCSHPYIFLFNTSIASVGTHKQISKICVSKFPIFKFLWNFKNRQNWILDVFLSFFCSHISSPVF